MKRYDIDLCGYNDVLEVQITDTKKNNYLTLIYLKESAQFSFTIDVIPKGFSIEMYTYKTGFILEKHSLLKHLFKHRDIKTLIDIRIPIKNKYDKNYFIFKLKDKGFFFTSEVLKKQLKKLFKR